MPLAHVANLSVMDATTMPNIMLPRDCHVRCVSHNKDSHYMRSTTYIAAVTSTGLSPEFHLASFNMGRAGSFWRPPRVAGLFSQSEKSHRSKSRPSPTFGFTFSALEFRPSDGVIAVALSSTAVVSEVASAVELNSSRYSLTSAQSTKHK